MKVAFAGTPEFAQVALEQLHAAGFAIPLVLTQPDRPAGRGMKLQASPVKQFAVAHGIPVAQPRSLRLDGKYPDDARAAQAALQAAAPDVMVVAAYGLILPEWVLTLPRLGCLNIHASLLPRWRGAAPIQRAIEAGDAESGVCIMQMERGLDTGPVLLEKRLNIGERETGGELHDRLARLGAEAIVEALAQLDALTPRPQDDVQATYARKLEKHEARIDWNEAAIDIERRVRAFNPWPVAFTTLDGQPLRIWRAEATAGAGQPGTVIAAANAGIDVATGDGALRILELQPAGKRVLTAAQFLNGHRLAAGAKLGD